MVRPYDLPSLTGLLCFEAAARHESFKTAAGELNVTPAAVSHQIKALEQDLGRTLFHRHSRGVQLTETGAWLFIGLGRGLQGISDTVEQVRWRTDSEEVVIQTTTAISSLWLTPQIAAFWRSHPRIAVSQVISESNTSGQCDLSIHYGTMPSDGGEYRHLFSDRIIALGSPDYAVEYGIETTRHLLTAPLIHLSAPETGWTGWTDWFTELGYEAPNGRRFAVNNYMIALRAAQDGIGAVLGWDGLLGQLIEQGDLVDLVPDRIPSPMAFYLKIHPRASRQSRLFCDWLAAEYN